jgi:hypothetical protein
VDARIGRAERNLRTFDRLAPEFRGLHPLEATSPQECTEITAHVFASLRFDSTYRIPSYRDWLDRTGHLHAYRFHKRFLQHLQFGQPAANRWVLKCPDHVFALNDMRAVYPDARIVFLHRDPVPVLLSVARLTDVVRRPFMRHVDRLEIGRQESLRWLAGAQRMIDASTAAPFATPPCHIHYLKLVSDPLGTVESLYGHFGLTLPGEAADAIRNRVRERPNGGYGAHHYRAEDYGLDLAAERERFAAYRAHFGIAAEPDEASPGRGRDVGRTLQTPVRLPG